MLLLTTLAQPQPTRMLVVISAPASALEEISGSPYPAIYYSIFLGTTRSAALAVRSRAGHDPFSLALPVQKAISSIDRDLPVSRVLTVQQIVGQSSIDASFDATLLLAFAVISLVLATAGLFGVLSYVTTQRTTEIGVRLALGSSRGEVLKLMLQDGLRPAIAGLALGLVASLGGTHFIRSLLYTATALDGSVFLMVSLTLLLAAVVACLIPAWRASRLDPILALRME